MSKEYTRIAVSHKVRDEIRARKAVESAKRNTNLSYDQFLTEALDLEVDN